MGYISKTMLLQQGAAEGPSEPIPGKDAPMTFQASGYMPEGETGTAVIAIEGRLLSGAWNVVATITLELDDDADSPASDSFSSGDARYSEWRANVTDLTAGGIVNVAAGS